MTLVKPQCSHPYQHSQAHCSPVPSHLRTRLSGLRAESTSQGPLEQGAGTGLRVALASRSPSSTPTYTPGASVPPKMGLAQQVCVKNSRPGAAAASQAPPLILAFQPHSSRGSRGCELHFLDEEAEFQRVRGTPTSAQMHTPVYSRMASACHKQASGATPPHSTHSAGAPRRDGTRQHTRPPAGSLGPHRGLPARKRPCIWAIICGAARAVRECVPWWMTSPGPRAQEGCCGCRPCSVQLRTPGKDAKVLKGPSADWPRQLVAPTDPHSGSKGCYTQRTEVWPPSGRAPNPPTHFTDAEAWTHLPGLSDSRLAAHFPFHFPEISKSHCSCQGS